MAFIIMDFEGHTFEKLRKKEASILGPLAVKELVKRGKRPNTSSRPLYCTSMEGLGICFNSHQKSQILQKKKIFFAELKPKLKYPYPDSHCSRVGSIFEMSLALAEPILKKKIP